MVTLLCHYWLPENNLSLANKSLTNKLRLKKMPSKYLNYVLNILIRAFFLEFLA